MRSRNHERLAEVYDEAVRNGGCFLTVPDFCRADRAVFIRRSDGFCSIAGEIELSERHCVVNCLRDLTVFRFHSVSTICPNDQIRRRVAAKISRHLPKALRPRVHIFVEADLRNGSFEKWIAQWSVGARAPAKDTKQKDGEVPHE